MRIPQDKIEIFKEESEGRAKPESKGGRGRKQGVAGMKKAQGQDYADRRSSLYHFTPIFS